MKESTKPLVLASPVSAAKTRRIWTWKLFFFSLLSFYALITQTQAAYQQALLPCPTQVSQWLTQCTKSISQELITETQSCFEGLIERTDLEAARTILLRRFQIAEFFMMSHGGTLKNFKEIAQFLKIYHKYIDNVSPQAHTAINQLDSVLAKTEECPFATIQLFIEKFLNTLQKIQELYELFQETCEESRFQAMRDSLDIREAILQLEEGVQEVKLKKRQPFFSEENLDVITFFGMKNTLVLFSNKAVEARGVLAAAQNFSPLDDDKNSIKKAKQGLNRIDKDIRELQGYFSSDAWCALIEQISCLPYAYLDAKQMAVLINQADLFLQKKLNHYDHRILYPLHLIIQTLKCTPQQKLLNQYASALKNFVEYSTLIDFMEQLLSKIKKMWVEDSTRPLTSEHEEALWSIADAKACDLLPLVKQCTYKNPKKLITIVRYYLSLLRIRMKTISEFKDGGSHLKNSFPDQPTAPPAFLYYFCVLRSVLTGQNELLKLRTNTEILNTQIFKIVCQFWREVTEQNECNKQHSGDNATKLCNDLAELIQTEWKDVSTKQAKKQSHEPKKPRRKARRKNRAKK